MDKIKLKLSRKTVENCMDREIREMLKGLTPFEQLTNLECLVADIRKVTNHIAVEIMRAKTQDIINNKNQYTCGFCKVEKTIVARNIEGYRVELMCSNCGTRSGDIEPFLPEFIEYEKEREKDK